MSHAEEENAIVIAAKDMYRTQQAVFIRESLLGEIGKVLMLCILDQRGPSDLDKETARNHLADALLSFEKLYREKK